MELPKRKSTRIPNYNYASENYYFITVCTDGKKCLFFTNGRINALGKIVERCLLQIPQHHKNARIDKYIVMPNHIHAIIAIEGVSNSSLTTMVGQMKAASTREIHKLMPDQIIWQRSFHDHIIRNQEGYLKIWEYIHTNLMTWQKDCFYKE